MDAQALFARLCSRHSLDPGLLSEYVPLVERALCSPDRVRERILRLVEDSLGRRAGGDPTATFDALESDLDDEILKAVAERLHGWSPPWRRRRTDIAIDPDDLGGTLPEGLGGGL